MAKLLCILLCYVRCIDSKRYIDTYVMLDPGTNASYCTEELRESLGAKGKVHQTELTR